MENSTSTQQNSPQSFVQNKNKIASYNYVIKDNEQNNYILDLIIQRQKILFEAKQSSDSLNQIYESEIELKELCQMSQKLFGAYKCKQEIDEDYLFFQKIFVDLHYPLLLNILFNILKKNIIINFIYININITNLFV